jgi:hypothetical protein
MTLFGWKPAFIRGAILIRKPLTLVGDPGAEIRGFGVGKVVTIAADDVTLRSLRITGSGLNLFDDDAAVFVTGNRATIEKNVIADSLHGIYLKKNFRSAPSRQPDHGQNNPPGCDRVDRERHRTKHRKLRHLARCRPAWQRNSPVELRKQSHPWQRNQ